MALFLKASENRSRWKRLTHLFAGVIIVIVDAPKVLGGLGLLLAAIKTKWPSAKYWFGTKTPAIV